VNVYINDTEVFLDGDQLPAFTLSLSDLLDPSSIRGTRSTTIRVLNTPESRSVLGSEAMAWNGADTRPTMKFKDGGVTVFESDVVVMRVDRNVMECAAIGGNASWFDWAKKTKLNELDLGLFYVTAANVAASWQSKAPLVYFPLIDYGRLEDRASSYAVQGYMMRPAIGIYEAMKIGFQSIDWNLRPKGSFAKHFEKFVITNGAKNAKSIDKANTPDTISISQAIIGLPIPYSYKRVGSASPTPIDPSDLTTSGDANGLFGFPGVVTMDEDRRIYPSFKNLLIELPPSYDGFRFRVCIWDATDDRELVGVWTRPMTALDAPTYTFTGSLPDVMALEGHDIHFAVMLDPDYGSASYLGDIDTSDPEAIKYLLETDYRFNCWLNVPTATPALGILDILKGINDWRGLVFNTSFMERRVEIWYDDEFFRPLTAGDSRSMSGRLDHTSPPAKLSQQLPSRITYKFKDDNDDREVTRISRIVGSPGYANAIVEIGGPLEERTITLPFAATAMGDCFDGNCMIPVIRKVGGDYQVDDFDIETRILVVDGLADGAWTLNHSVVESGIGTGYSQYPKCYFVWPGSGNIPMAFDEAMHLAKGFGANTTQGTTRTTAIRRIHRMAESNVLEAVTKWNDHELTDFDFGKPTLVDDGHSVGIYYVQKIDGFRIGGTGYAKTLFIQA